LTGERPGRLRALIHHPVFRASSLRVLALATGIVASVVIARLGGADVKGVTSAFAASSVLAFTAVNLDLVQQTLRHARTTDTIDAVRGRIVRLWPWYAVLTALVAVAGLLSTRPYVAWLAAGTLAYLIRTHLGLACTGLAGPTTTAIGSIVQQAGLAVACLAAFVVGRLDIMHAPLIVIISFLAPLPLYVWATRPRRRALRREERGDPGILALVRSGVRWQGARLAQVLLLRMDILWVFAMLGAAPAGIYSVGLATAALAGIVPAQFASNTTYEAMQGRRAPLRRNARSAALTGLIAGLVLAAAGWPLLILAYGREFEAAYAVMLATLPGVIAYGVLQVYTNHMRLVAEAHVVAIPSAIGALVMLVGLAVATPQWGLLGAALASSTGPLAAIAVAYRLSSRRSVPTAELTGV
jgi:O-antigen/teichoic acid export membrane protein